MNGRKHGIFDQQPSPNLDQMLKTRVEEAAAFWKPRGDSELDCVRRMADARFRIDLCLASEPGLLACKLSSRYATAFTNQFFRALDDLDRLRRPVRKRSPNKSKVRIETGLEIGVPLAA